MGKEFLFHVIKNVLELNSHDGYTTVNIVKQTKNPIKLYILSG